MKLPAIKISEKWLVSAGVALLAAIAVAGFAVAVYAAWLFHDLPDASELAEYRPPTATRVYAGDGTLIGEFSDERRIYVPYEQMPTPLVQAFLAAEDRNFFQHGGIDVSGLGRAMLKNVFNFATGRRLEGGSTITQQVAKNVLLTSESSLNRKLKEAILASRLEAALSKEEILELYLNEIFLGYRSYGVATAAYNYFGKSLNQLTVEEAAFLAALPKGPNNYHPKRHPEAAKARRDWVLGEMEESRFITEAQLTAARAKPLVTQDGAAPGVRPISPKGGRKPRSRRPRRPSAAPGRPLRWKASAVTTCASAQRETTAPARWWSRTHAGPTPTVR